MLALAETPSADVHERAAAATRRYAHEKDGLANWPPDAEDGLNPNSGGQIRVQFLLVANGREQCGQ